MRERLALPDESHTGIQVVRVIAALVHRVIDNRVDRLVLHTHRAYSRTQLSADASTLRDGRVLDTLMP